MNNLVSNILSASIGGIVVLAFGYFIFSEREAGAIIQTEYHAISYGGDLAVEQSFQANQLLKASALRLSKDESFKFDQKNDKNHAFEELAKFFEQSVNWSTYLEDGVLGVYGYIEELKIKNTENEVSASVLLEGRDIGFAVVESRSGGKQTFRDDFNVELKLLPNESATVLHVAKDQIPHWIF